MSRLDPWRNGLEPPKGEDADRILQSNFDEQAKFNDKIGLYLVGEASTSTEQALTSTSFVAWSGLKQSSLLTGGLAMVVIQANLKLVGSAVTARLMINGQEKRRWIVASTGIDTHSPCWIWFGNLAGEQTTFEVQAKVDTASAELQDSIYGIASSYIQVLEFTKG
jgi:hypothetical protein